MNGRLVRGTRISVVRTVVGAGLGLAVLAGAAGAFAGPANNDTPDGVRINSARADGVRVDSTPGGVRINSAPDGVRINSAPDDREL